MELASSDAMAVRFALPVLHSPLSFLGRLKPFFSFWKRKKRMGSKTLPVCAERRQPPLGKGAFEWTESSAPAGVKVNFKSCKRADEYPRGAGRICNAPSSRTAALGIGPYKVYRRFSDFHTPQVQSKALVDRRGPGKPSERFPRSLFFCQAFSFWRSKKKMPSASIFSKKGKNGFEKFVFLLKEKPKWERSK